MSFRGIHLGPFILLLVLANACSSARLPSVPSSPLSLPTISSTTRAGSPRLIPDSGETGSGGGDKQRSLAALPAGFVSVVATDARYIASAPFRWNRSEWSKVGLATLAVGGAMFLDETIRDVVTENSSATTHTIANAIQPFGAESSFVVLGGFYLAGRYLHNDKARLVAEDGLASSLIAAGAIAPLLKATVGRSRPSQTEGTFVTGEGNVSFPSGHTTQAFAVASVIASHYDSPWVKTAAYGLAGLVGWARIENNAHYASDVLAGALIGTIVGRTVVRLHENQRFAVAASPSLDPSAPGVALTFRMSSSDILRLFQRHRQ